MWDKYRATQLITAPHCNMFPLLLASASPRRKQLLEQVGFVVTTRPVDIDETPRPDEHAIQLVTRLAESKADAAIRSRRSGEPRVGVSADTIVWTDDGDVLGKPSSAAAAVDMLCSLSGSTHHVTTGYSIFETAGAVVTTRAVTTDVQFREFSADDAARYVATGEPLDKAGSYGIQGIGAVLVRGIAGSYTNVVGLPVSDLVATMRSQESMTGLPWSADDRA